MGKPSTSGLVTRAKKKVCNFTITCKCTFHEVYSSLSITTNKLFNIKTSHEYSRTALKWLIEAELFSPNANYVCSACINYASKQLKSSPSFSSSISTSTPTPLPIHHVNNTVSVSACDGDIEMETMEIADSALIQGVVEKLLNRLISENDVVQLCKALGGYLNIDIFNDSKELVDISAYKDFSNIPVSCEPYLENRNKALVSFLSSIVQCKKKPTPKHYKVCLILEQIYSARNKKFVGPYSFSQNTLKWSFSGSKAAHTIDGLSSASGSISTLSATLKD